MLLRSVAAIVFVAAAVTPAVAQQDIVCDEASIMKLEQGLGQIPDGAKKIESAKEITMAKEAMAANDIEKCKSHLGNAVKGMDAM
ncbi:MULTISPECIES: hypothetical protein [Ensifer]|uniref:Uncharacterized protein n=1 Tax=Ensifer canadensis TaxID=555315 RepID=A0AAW4FUF0_9HYPH|nr:MULTISPECIES: hypothetical protein [Ensifer]KQU96036.1 hypothetical protein ASD00_20050 [Ensifer sp. Root31]KQW34927.1 hypothetical protein ASD02_17070 [Ensifer sp. Root1252]KQY77041.1 hypothetical protein ASD52_23940 [Ensifer sp. Root142]KRC57251.1 hypothetical protein ASE32_20385 [Ensifer sp. Root231]KRC87746.1 hypothetical protein ASE47_14540 [Ensifer sp. Root258]